MRLAIVVTVLGQHEMADVAIRQLVENATLPDTHVFVVDNGGDYRPDIEGITIVRPGRNIGVYPVFDLVFEDPALKEYEVVAFLHSDVMIVEKGFDARILDRFTADLKLGMIGFVGSNEIDYNGGRGGGTCSNFQGMLYPLDHDKDPKWQGSPAEAHGRRETGSARAVVVDGCVMVVRRAAWEKIGYREGFPPHHFYDRLISTQMLEAGYEIEVLGVAFDHLGGQTVSRESRYHDVAREYCERHKVEPLRDPGTGTPNWDATIYLKGETDWLREYRDRKHIVPIKV